MMSAIPQVDEDATETMSFSEYRTRCLPLLRAEAKSEEQDLIERQVWAIN